MARILHIWDQAAVACTLAKYQRRFGHDVLVIKRNGFDPFRIMDFYNEKTLTTYSNKLFQFIITRKVKDYDVIHIHDHFMLLPRIRKKYPHKKIILHYHGTLLRQTPQSVRKEAESYADIILVSTPDLLNFVNGTYLHNPIDIEHFSPRKITRNSKALCLMSKWETEKLIRNHLNSKDLKLNLETIDRNQQAIPYSKMPDFLANYEFLVDLKLVYDNKPLPALSCLGLQALSVGLKVIDHNLDVVEDFPQEHHPEMVTTNLMEIISRL